MIVTVPRCGIPHLRYGQYIRLGVLFGRIVYVDYLIIRLEVS